MVKKTPHRTVRFKAVSVVSKPTRISFTTNSGQIVSFKSEAGLPKTIENRFLSKKK